MKSLPTREDQSEGDDQEDDEPRTFAQTSCFWSSRSNGHITVTKDWLDLRVIQ